MRATLSKRAYVQAAVFVTLLLALIAVPAKPTYALSYGYSNFPQGTIGLVRPDIGVRINLSEYVPVQFSQFFINDEQLDITFDKDTSTFLYKPDKDLQPGVYRVRLQFQLDGYQPAILQWSFTVAKNASALADGISEEQEKGLAAINDYRKLLGLPAVKFNTALNTAAMKHAQYLAQNAVDAINTNVSLHSEQKGKPGYIGASLGDRLEYVGYMGGGGEDVAFNQSTLVEAIDSLFNAPYHRSPFMMPDMKEIGVYRDGDYHVVEFGYDSGGLPQMVVSPASSDPYVPTSFDGHESPDPLRLHPKAEYPVGYPMMAGVYGSNVEKVSILEVSLQDAKGNNVSLLTNEPDKDDHLTNEVIFMADKPLQPDAVYSAHVKLNVSMSSGGTQVFQKDWQFRTEPTPGIGAQKLHEDAVTYKMQLVNFGLTQTHTVKFGLDADQYTLDDVAYPMRQLPYIVNGTSYLYIRDLAAALGAEVAWDDANKAAIYKKKDQTITFYTNRAAYAINGTEYATESPAQLINETTMIPVRLLSQALGAKVDYVDSTRTVVITY
ncbi:S-layer protein [Paenibacillus athensensis]|uniref:S-layer protein n=1 Tax=Paenibacillus athensensis TaxID=1967502 RepID=A0A4Y8Q7S4_9BACL|nr:stalk domain-containing protein [Paenibacillus athensensis]MCD1260184.1 S-layer protein [Paenibacillus athensensis]